MVGMRNTPPAGAKPRQKPPKHAHAALINAIGHRKVAERFGVEVRNVGMWKVRGIPPLKLIAFGRLAAEHRVTLPEGFYDPLDAG